MIGLYEFECPKCDASYLREVSSLTTCPRCTEEMNLTHIVHVNTNEAGELMRNLLNHGEEVNEL